MNDTSPEAREMMSELLMRRSGGERFVMGAPMFDAAREPVVASMQANLPLAEFRRGLFERVHSLTITRQSLIVLNSV
jgi:hypothetical protein